MSENHKQILSEEVVFQKIKRMSYEILENNLEEPIITLVGIFDKGYLIAEQMQKELKGICEKEIRLVRLDIDKDNPNKSNIRIDTDVRSLDRSVLVLVDDVLNSGRTTSYSLAYMLECNVKKVELAALVNRSHKSFPLTPTYKGYEIATMIDEYIEVRVKDRPGVYLHS